ncbi:hypothetical protein BDF22DRAFT_747489 [Syncephalis plumigaleata]|nr:hypothetical protein BDF22DRAFT_747489 [Syncephalis plumigaleata]
MQGQPYWINLTLLNTEHSNYIANQQIRVGTRILDVPPTKQYCAIIQIANLLVNIHMDGMANLNMKFSAVIAIAVAVVAVASLVTVEAGPLLDRRGMSGRDPIN